MITAKVQYALILLKDIRDKEDSRPIKLKMVAQAHALDLNFLEQVARNLRIAGLLRSVRGPGGGYIAARDLAGTKLVEVMDAVEASKKLKHATGSETSQQLNQAIHLEAVRLLGEVTAL